MSKNAQEWRAPTLHGNPDAHLRGVARSSPGGPGPAPPWPPSLLSPPLPPLALRRRPKAAGQSPRHQPARPRAPAPPPARAAFCSRPHAPLHRRRALRPGTPPSLQRLSWEAGAGAEALQAPLQPPAATLGPAAAALAGWRCRPASRPRGARPRAATSPATRPAAAPGIAGSLRGRLASAAGPRRLGITRQLARALGGCTRTVANRRTVGEQWLAGAMRGAHPRAGSPRPPRRGTPHKTGGARRVSGQLWALQASR